MLSQPHTLLLATVGSVAFLHTLLGPDHYLPFVSLGRAGRWTRLKLAAVTAACGLGHVLSSVALALAGVSLGWGLTSLDAFQAVQGRWTAWGLVAFGVLYGAWGLTRAVRRRPHTHGHRHADGTTPWLLFALFLLGPCEPMIPLVMYPAAVRDWAGLVAVATVFTLVTVGTMVAVTLACDHGVRRVRIPALEPYGHAIAGGTVAACGLGVALLGL